MGDAPVAYVFSKPSNHKQIVAEGGTRFIRVGNASGGEGARSAVYELFSVHGEVESIAFPEQQPAFHCFVVFREVDSARRSYEVLEGSPPELNGRPINVQFAVGKPRVRAC
jgi:hypothetical protein